MEQDVQNLSLMILLVKDLISMPTVGILMVGMIWGGDIPLNLFIIAYHIKLVPMHLTKVIQLRKWHIITLVPMKLAFLLEDSDIHPIRATDNITTLQIIIKNIL